jgi:hypothetical protein
MLKIFNLMMNSKLFYLKSTSNLNMSTKMINLKMSKTKKGQKFKVCFNLIKVNFWSVMQKDKMRTNFDSYILNIFSI